MDPAFVGAGRAPGMEIWRIENRAPVKGVVNGKLYSGDSYILLVTKVSPSGAFNWAIHFWLGSESSQDEYGIAAYKTVELDESLGGAPVQYREVQGNESPLFLSYFRDIGLEYLPGGVASGFRTVEKDVYRPRLLHLKGKRTVRVNEVPLSNRSLNTGDVFILDLGLKLFVFNGERANKQEKSKGVEVVTKIKNQERGGRATVTIINEDPNNAEFWSALGGKITVTNAGEDDQASDARMAASLALFKVSDASGAVQFARVSTAGATLSKSQLDSSDVFIVDTSSELYVWVGNNATPAEKREGMIRASTYLQQNGRPNNTAISRVVEGAETPIFKALFSVWDPPASFAPSSIGGRVAHVQASGPVDIAALQARRAAEDNTVDDGSGRVQVWRIENFEKAPVPESKYGQFFGGDSYVLVYTYVKNRTEQYIIYFWQGRESSQDEKGASALLAKQLDDEMGDRPVQVRVVQGKEPSHFRTMFHSSMIVHAGGKASGFRNRVEDETVSDVGLFHVKGTNELNTYAVQCPGTASSLNSGDVFVLVTPSTVFVWQGSHANAPEAAIGGNIARILAADYNGTGGRSVTNIHESSEPEAFWSALGGRGEYASIRPGEPAPKDPRLFQCSNATGAFRVEEIVDYTQEDLLDEDVFLLDVYTALYVWIGSQSNETEKREAMATATRFIAESTDGRDPDSPIMIVRSGAEPLMFTQFFTGWDSSLAERNKFVDPYEARLAKMRGTSAPVEETKTEAGPVVDYAATSSSFSYEALKTGNAPNIDPAVKELYLSNAEFATVMGCSKAEFAKMPKWKQQAKKKEVGLF